MGRSRHGRPERLAELAGAPPRLASPADLTSGGPREARAHAVQRSATTSPAPHRINLRAVAEALVDEGLDPATEIARILRGEVEIDPETGDVAIDPATGEPRRRFLVDTDTRLRTLGEVLQYVQPKLKSVEVKVSGALELSGDQLDARIAALVQRAQGATR